MGLNYISSGAGFLNHQQYDLWQRTPWFYGVVQKASWFRNPYSEKNRIFHGMGKVVPLCHKIFQDSYLLILAVLVVYDFGMPLILHPSVVFRISEPSTISNQTSRFSSLLVQVSLLGLCPFHWLFVVRSFLFRQDPSQTRGCVSSARKILFRSYADGLPCDLLGFAPPKITWVVFANLDAKKGSSHCNFRQKTFAKVLQVQNKNGAKLLNIELDQKAGKCRQKIDP